MKHAQSSTGGLLFQPHEWLTSKQIASFFSILSKSQRAKSVEGGTESFERRANQPGEPINQDKPLQALQLIVETQVQADHPILFTQSEQGKLGKLRLHVLKKACSEFQVVIMGAETKKDTFVAALHRFIVTHRSKSCKFCNCENTSGSQLP